MEREKDLDTELEDIIKEAIDEYVKREDTFIEECIEEEVEEELFKYINHCLSKYDEQLHRRIFEETNFPITSRL